MPRTGRALHENTGIDACQASGAGHRCLWPAASRQLASKFFNPVFHAKRVPEFLCPEVTSEFD
jgi:hypothetical protein